MVNIAHNAGGEHHRMITKEQLQEILANTYMKKLDEGRKAAFYFIVKEVQNLVDRVDK